MLKIVRSYFSQDYIAGAWLAYDDKSFKLFIMNPLLIKKPLEIDLSKQTFWNFIQYFRALCDLYLFKFFTYPKPTLEIFNEMLSVICSNPEIDLNLLRGDCTFSSYTTAGVSFVYHLVDREIANNPLTSKSTTPSIELYFLPFRFQKSYKFFIYRAQDYESLDSEPVFLKFRDPDHLFFAEVVKRLLRDHQALTFLKLATPDFLTLLQKELEDVKYPKNN